MTPDPRPDIPARRPSPQDLRLVRRSIRLSRPIRPGAKPSLRLYERLWRPASFHLASRITTRTERHRAAVSLHLGRAHRVLDIGCGPGNFTEPLSGHPPDGGLAVGFDISAPTLTSTALDNRGPRTCHIRGHARMVPFGDETFDAVCCFGAL
ncbi:methyltransferase [Mycobacterium tuberculosis]|uniref:Methyltransferase n=1 Tax=Mycobacterium tuberculosis TaxID=1773 RepID=A0A0U0QKS2_MYCTX|nr:methyltransferase [Mycobacterium tuberculosis]